MAVVYKLDMIDVDLDRGTVRRSFSNHLLSGGDAGADRFGVYLYRSGVPANLSGTTCTGYFIKPDGNIVLIPGVIYDNLCYVELPQSCYLAEGTFTLTIRLSAGAYTSTVRVVDGTVLSTADGNIIDPSGAIPSIDAYTTLVAQATAAANRIEAYDISSSQITGTRYRINATTS